MAVYKTAEGKWAAQVYDRRVGGKRHIGTFPTKAEATAAFNAEKDKLQRSKITVSAWREEWMKNPSWRLSTRIANEQRTAEFDRVYGHKRLVDISRTVARSWITERPADLNPLRAMFGAALYEDDEFGNPLIVDNPFSRIVKVTRPKRDLEPEWLTEDDIRGLERAALEILGTFGPNFASMIRFAAETGIRTGELFGLMVEDLKPEDGCVVIRRAVDSKSRTLQLPKNGKPRMIVMSNAAYAAALQAVRPKNCDYVFPTPRGTRFHASTLSYHWNPVRIHAGRPKMHFYELRHYCATRLLEIGLSCEDVAVQLGHTDGGRLVREVYGHPSTRKARDRIRDAVNRDEDDGEDDGVLVAA